MNPLGTTAGCNRRSHFHRIIQIWASLYGAQTTFRLLSLSTVTFIEQIPFLWHLVKLQLTNKKRQIKYNHSKCTLKLCGRLFLKISKCFVHFSLQIHSPLLPRLRTSYSKCKCIIHSYFFIHTVAVKCRFSDGSDNS